MGFNPECVDCSTVDPPVSPITPPKDPVSGGGLPPGGNAGQVLTKASSADGDAIWADGGSGGGSILQDIVATKTVGGVTEGTRIPAGTSYEDLFKWILAPARTPTLTNPSAALTANASKLLLGYDESFGSVVFDLSFNRGSIQPAYGTNGYRSGEATSYKVDGKDGQRVTIDMDAKLPGAGTVTITGSVAYAAGEQPKDSSGNNYASPLSAGSVNSNGITFEKKYYIYTTQSGSLARMPIEQYNASPLDFSQKHGDGVTTPKSAVALPSRATGIFVWNELTEKWQEDSREFDETTQVIDGITYYVYTDNRPYTAGNRRLKFTW